MKLLLARGADPKIKTELGVTALHVAAGIGWVEGITYEWSPKDTLEAVRMLLDLGLDPNAQADTGRVALHGAAHKGATDVVQLLVRPRRQAGHPRLRQHRQPRRQELAIHTWHAGRLRRRPRPRRRAVGDSASGDRPAAAQADDRQRACRRRPSAARSNRSASPRPASNCGYDGVGARGSTRGRARSKKKGGPNGPPCLTSRP